MARRGGLTLSFLSVISYLVLLQAGCGSGGVPSASPAPPPHSASGHFVEINAPGAGTTIALGTTVQDINSSGEIAGFFTDANRVKHGFHRYAGGAMTVFDAPGAGTGVLQGTDAEGINGSGTIVGTVIDSHNALHGYVRASDGTFTVFDVPGAQRTEALAINDSGMVTGDYSDAAGTHGFVRAGDGSLTTFDGPVVPPTAFGNAYPVSINAAGTVVGSDVDRGFLRSPNGTIVTFDASGAGDGITAATDINDNGLIVGSVQVPYYCDITCTYISSSFVGQANAFSMFNPPVAYSSSTAKRVNSQGAIAGEYIDGNQVAHGYIRNPDGSFVIVDEPNAAQTVTKGTHLSDLNAGGAAVGYYFDATGARHGFLLEQ